MPQVVIAGAGPLGGELAFLLARRDVAASILLVDEAGQVAAGKALDIMQSAPVEPFATRVSGTADLVAMSTAPVVVVADRLGTGEWQGEDGMMLLRRLARAGSMPIVIAAGAAQHEIVERGVRELKMDRRRILGSAPEALAAAVRAITALEADRSPCDIALTVLGRPPLHVVIPWEDATIAGLAAVRVLDEPTRRRIVDRVRHLWPPGPLTLAAAAAKAVTAALGHSRQSMIAFTAADDAMGIRARTVALPVVVGPAGVEPIELPTLSAHDRVALDNALML
jgi:malate dehydrogenase